MKRCTKRFGKNINGSCQLSFFCKCETNLACSCEPSEMQCLDPQAVENKAIRHSASSYKRGQRDTTGNSAASAEEKKKGKSSKFSKWSEYTVIFRCPPLPLAVPPPAPPYSLISYDVNHQNHQIDNTSALQRTLRRRNSLASSNMLASGR